MNMTQLGFLAIERGHRQEAVNIFRRALEQKKAPDAYFGLGLAYYELEDLPSARWAFYQALERNRDHQKAKEYIERIEQTKRTKPPAVRRSNFRVGRDHLEVFDGIWKKFFIKGVNLGLGIPGHFPGEFAIKTGTYLAWFRQITELGANALRVYTLHPPGFYEALARFNGSGARLFLLQGVWTELPEGNDFRNARFLAALQEDIRNAVDAVYGNAALPERPGYANGTYAYDVSPYLAGFIVGREWESCAVKGFNELHKRKQGEYHGTHLLLRSGNPFELWIAELCDGVQRYEHERYGVTHPVSAANWPTLDPLAHPSESPVEEEYVRQGFLSRQRGVCLEGHDEESLDVSSISAHAGSGFFASYHVYPYYPDFMVNGYPGRSDPYRAYLDALKRYHGQQPVLIAEFGVPCSRETAHWHPGGRDHGRHSDVEQGRINGLMMRSIHEAGMAGGVLFSWFDEWCKKTWLFGDYSLPRDRRPYWFNLQDPEQNYGLLAAYPGYPRKKVSLTCSGKEWKNATVLYDKAGSAMVYSFNDGSDDSRRLVRLSAQHDEGFLYLRLETAGQIDFSQAHYVIGIDTTVSGAGERRIPFRTDLLSPVGLTFLCHLAGKEQSRILVAAPYERYRNAAAGTVRPRESGRGAWIVMQNQTNRRRLSRDGKQVYPARVATMSRLRYGSLAPRDAAYDSLADFSFRDHALELRIPWGLINFTDPSSKSVLWKEGDRMTTGTAGVRVLALSYKPAAGGLTAVSTGLTSNHTDRLPAEWREDRFRTYSWTGWDTPVFHTFLKESYHVYRRFLTELPDYP